MSKIADLWAQRERLAAEVEVASQACSAGAGEPQKMKAAEEQWGAGFDELHDLDDEIMDTPPFDQSDLAQKARVFLMRSTEDLPYLHYARQLAGDLVRLGS